MVVETGSFQAETFLNSTPLHETSRPNRDVSHIHGFGQMRRNAKTLAFAIESTVELKMKFVLKE